MCRSESVLCKFTFPSNYLVFIPRPLVTSPNLVSLFMWTLSDSHSLYHRTPFWRVPLILRSSIDPDYDSGILKSTVVSPSHASRTFRPRLLYRSLSPLFTLNLTQIFGTGHPFPSVKKVVSSTLVLPPADSSPFFPRGVGLRRRSRPSERVPDLVVNPLCRFTVSCRSTVFRFPEEFRLCASPLHCKIQKDVTLRKHKFNSTICKIGL